MKGEVQKIKDSFLITKSCKLVGLQQHCAQSERITSSISKQ
jgi:hypothetical protein